MRFNKTKPRRRQFFRRTATICGMWPPQQLQACYVISANHGRASSPTMRSSRILALSSVRLSQQQHAADNYHGTSCYPVNAKRGGSCSAMPQNDRSVSERDDRCDQHEPTKQMG